MLSNTPNDLPVNGLWWVSVGNARLRDGLLGPGGQEGGHAHEREVLKLQGETRNARIIP